jgi:hypothetical protein
MRLGLLKRLESSSAAFTASVRAYRRLLQRFIAAGRQRLWFDVRRDRGLHREVDGAVQLALDRLALGPWPAHIDRASTLHDARRELETVDLLLLHCAGRALTGTGPVGAGAPARESAGPGTDPKLARLEALLDDELRDEQVLLFTEYRETARVLWQRLAPRGGVALIHGGEARLGRSTASRGAVIRRFAPLSNGVAPPRPHERVRLLIATDVLAEGLNLQDARVVVSYDVPWNPVRLAQRIGRIDRLGSPHESVIAYAFRPDRHVDALLGLVRRVSRKLRDIRTVGGDAPLLAERADAMADWSTAERLRLEYAACAATVEPAGRGVPAALLQGRPAPADHQPGPGPDDPGSSGAGRSTLVAFRAGAAVHCVLVSQRVGASAAPDIQVDAPAADLALLAALREPAIADKPPAPSAPDANDFDASACRVDETAAPRLDASDASRLDAAERLARRALHRHLRRGGLAVTAAAEPAARQAAAGVRAWLSGRPGGATADEADAADRLLAALRRCDLATSRRIAALGAAPRHDEEQWLRRLETLLVQAAARTASPAPTARIRTLAAVDFVGLPPLDPPPDGI